MRNRNWVFGKKSGLTFAPSPSPFVAAPIDTYEGCASISDTNGNLVLYSNGVTVWDGLGTVRITGLQGNPNSTQAAVIVPDPANNRRYYVFTSDGSSGTNHHFNGTLIDTLTWTQQPLSSLMTMPSVTGLSPTEKLVALSPVGSQSWVMTVVQWQTALAEALGPGLLRVFRVTPAGISHFGDQPLLHPVSDIGYMKASKGGIHIALANQALANILVVPFNALSGLINPGGIITIPVTVPPFNTNGYVYGLEFSPSGQLLYYSTLFPLPIASSPVSDGHVFQYQLPNGPPILIGTHPNNQAGDFALGALLLADDGRIYIAQDGETKLGVIAHPDLPGTACGLTFSAVQLAPGTLCRAGLPNMIRDLTIL
jgi:hypothetical protein